MKSKNISLVSIAVCTYNGQKHIAEQLDSIFRQTYKHIEVIVVDDCSTDQTLSILKDYKVKFANFSFYVNEQNLGYVKNFERAISLCNGEYIALSDQDDIWTPNKIEKQLEHIGENALIYHDSKCIDENGNEINRDLSEIYRLYQGKSSLPFLFYNCVSGHSLVFKRSILSLIIPFDKRFFHDRWIAFVASENGGIKLLNEKLVSYRQHQTSITDFLSLKETKKTKKAKQSFFSEDFMDWARKCEESSIENFSFYQRFVSCFNDKNQLLSPYKLFFLLITNLDLILFINKKSKSSKINFVRKLCFGLYKN